MSETHHLDGDISGEGLADLHRLDLPFAGECYIDASYAFHETKRLALVEHGVHVVADERDGWFRWFSARDGGLEVRASV